METTKDKLDIYNIIMSYDEVKCYFHRALRNRLEMKLKCAAEGVPFLEYHEYVKHCDEADIDGAQWFLEYAAQDNSIINLKDFYFYDDNGKNPSVSGLGVRISVNLKSIDILELLNYLQHINDPEPPVNKANEAEKVECETHDDDEPEEEIMSIELKKHTIFEYQCSEVVTYHWHVTIYNKVFDIKYTDDNITCAGHHVVCEISELVVG